MAEGGLVYAEAGGGVEQGKARSHREKSRGERIERLWERNDRLAQKHGERSTIITAPGECYKGHWRNNLPDGKGTYVYSSGDKYEGEWKEGLKHGQGTMWILMEEKYIVQYTGQWHRGKWQGYGVLYNEYGERYEGFFREGKRNGRGQQTYGGTQGSGVHVYEGEWVNDNREGRGTLTMANGDVYEGSWKNDIKDGLGVFYYAEKGMKYEGVWKEDVPKCGSYTKVGRRDGKGFELPVLEIKDPQQVVRARIDEVLAQREQTGA